MERSQQFDDAIKVLRSCGNVTRLGYLRMFKEMESKYPGKGWQEEGKKLQEHYIERGLDLHSKNFGLTFPELFKRKP